MNLTEIHIINEKHPFFNECDELCFKSKNLYNKCLYNIRQNFFNTKKYLNYNDNYHLIKSSNEYNSLPTKVSCQIIKLVDRNFKSFFRHIKSKKRLGKVNIPSYLPPDSGRMIVIYPKQSISKKVFKKGNKIYLSKSRIYIKPINIKKYDDIKEVRIIPKGNHYKIEVVYKVKENELKKDNKKYCGGDIGINNLITLTFNNGINPILINGKPLKSINQFYNKKLAELKSELEIKNKQKTSKQIKKLTLKRNNKINDYLHKSSRLIVNHLVSNDISKIVIGKNNGWKQDINIGRINNQNFIQIPFNNLIHMIEYKCKLVGIDFKLINEAYTSKCSFLDNEKTCFHKKYKGRRIKRGLFKTENGYLINADVNASYNILKKEFPNAFANGIEGIGVDPSLINVNIN